MDHYYETFFTYISQHVELPEHDRASILATFHPLWVAKDTLLDKTGRVPKYHNFIVSDYMRKCYVAAKGEEVTTDLNEGPRFFSAG